MNFEPPENIEKEFPAGEDDHEKQVRRKEPAKKKESRKDKKDKGYMMFEEEDSEEELVNFEDVKSPSKIKKPKPTFRFPKKDIFPKSKEKDEKKEGKKEEKEKKKDEKDGKRQKLKFRDKMKSKSKELHITAGVYEKPVFGVPLAVAVERSKCHDGIELPAIFRECIDYIEEHGLFCEGIYRISGVKSKVQMLKEAYNSGIPAYLYEHEPNVVASLLKQFLRELPEPVLTTAAMPKFEEASTIKNDAKRVEQFQKLIQDLPTCNRLLLSWMIVHMTHIIKRQVENKMSLQNVSIVLSPTMQISHRVLNVLFSHIRDLFHDAMIKKYIPPLKPATSRWSLELPDNPSALEEELAKQESLLNQLHEELNAGVEDPSKGEQLWEVQRVVTQLKRKIKFARKAIEAVEKRKKDLEQQKRVPSVHEEEELCLELQEIPKTIPENVPVPETKQEDEDQKKDEQPEEKEETGGEETTEMVASIEPAEVDDKAGETEVGEEMGSEEADQEVPDEVEDTKTEKVEGLEKTAEKDEESKESIEIHKTDDEDDVGEEATTAASENVEKPESLEEYVNDEELADLEEEEDMLKLEEEELLAISDELRKKILTEQNEIERLHQEIVELQYLRQDSDLEDLSSSSESTYESEDEDDLQEILNQLIHENEQLEKKNTELCQKIHEERMICLDVKVQIRMLQQKQQDPGLSVVDNVPEREVTYL